MKHLSFLLYLSQSSFDRVGFKVNKRLDRVRINVRVLNQTGDYPRISGKVYQYLELGAENLNESALSQPVELKFKVSNKWLKDNGVNKEEIALYRHKNGWNKLNTSSFLVTNESTSYVSYSPGFSYFAVAATKEALEVTKPKEAVKEEAVKEQEKIEEAPAITEIEGGAIQEAQEGGFFVITGKVIGGAYKERPFAMTLLTLFILGVIGLFIYSHAKNLTHWPFHFKHKKKWLVTLVIILILFIALFVHFVLLSYFR